MKIKNKPLASELGRGASGVVALSHDKVIDILKTGQNALYLLSLNCQNLFAKYYQRCVYI